MTHRRQHVVDVPCQGECGRFVRTKPRTIGGVIVARIMCDHCWRRVPAKVRKANVAAMRSWRLADPTDAVHVLAATRELDRTAKDCIDSIRPMRREA